MTDAPIKSSATTSAADVPSDQEMCSSEIPKAIAARQTQITQFQSDIETLQRAAIIVGRTGTTAKAASQAKAKIKKKTKTKAKAARPKAKRKRPKMSAAAKKAVSKRMKAYWAKRRKAKG